MTLPADRDMPRSFSCSELRRAVSLPAVGVMRDVILNPLKEAVRREHGVDTWDDLLDAAEFSGNFRSVGSYPDEEMAKLALATGALDLPAVAVIR